MRDAILAHFGRNPGIGYDFRCAEGHAGLVLMGSPLDYTRIFADQSAGGFTVAMPCGKTMTYDELPSENVACACGEPTHWFVYRVST